VFSVVQNGNVRIVPSVGRKIFAIVVPLERENALTIGA
jgi:hypothetical protein